MIFIYGGKYTKSFLFYIISLFFLRSFFVDNEKSVIFATKLMVLLT